MLIMWRIQQMNHEVVQFHWFNFINRFRLNNRGETDPNAGKGGDKGVTFSDEQQAFMNKVIDQKYASWKKEETTKYHDYDDLVKFKQENQKAQDAKAQQELENAKKYDEAKKGYETKITELSQALSKKDQAIADLNISHTLTNEIVRQNGYTEETLALVRGNAVLNADGNIIIKSKDANGVDISVSVTEGVKKVLEARPYLVKSTHKQGAGTGAGGGETGGAGRGAGQGANDLMTLNSQLQDAIRNGDYTEKTRLTKEIKSAMAKRKALV